MIPLGEIIADTLGKGVNTQAVTGNMKNDPGDGPELKFLLKKVRQRSAFPGPKVVGAIMNVRNGHVQIEPGMTGLRKDQGPKEECHTNGSVTVLGNGD